jgi:hypothetical protein
MELTLTLVLVIYAAGTIFTFGLSFWLLYASIYHESYLTDSEVTFEEYWDKAFGKEDTVVPGMTITAMFWPIFVWFIFYFVINFLLKKHNIISSLSFKERMSNRAKRKHKEEVPEDYI